MKIYHIYGIRHEATVLAETSELAISEAIQQGDIGDWEIVEGRTPVTEIDTKGYSLVRWIPISERKPEYNKEIWMRYKNAFGYTVKFASRITGKPFTEADEWKIADGITAGMADTDEWMEIPT